MDLKARILESLEECTFFQHSNVELAHERLEGRSLSPVTVAIFCDTFRADLDKALANYVNHYLDYFEADPVVTYMPAFNGTSKRLVPRLRKLGREVTGLEAEEVDWRKTEEDIKEEIVEKVLAQADVVLFVSDGKSREWRPIYNRVYESGYLVTRKIRHETRNQKSRRGKSDQVDVENGSDRDQRQPLQGDAAPSK